jgi:hypothetical protein
LFKGKVKLFGCDAVSVEHFKTQEYSTVQELDRFHELPSVCGALIAHNIGETCGLAESGLAYVTGEYGNDGKVFKRTILVRFSGKAWAI